MAVNAGNLKRTGKGTPPALAPTNHNLNKRGGGKNVPLQLNIPPEERRAFKVYCAQHETDMSIVFVDMFHEYREKHE